MSTLLVASTGGHLAQLWRLWPRIRAGGGDPDALWMTFDTQQSRSLLTGEEVAYVPYIAPRDAANMLRNVRVANTILRHRRISRVVSTGSGIALSVLPLSAAMGIPSYFIESAARTVGPSLTGKLLSRVPRIRTYAQYKSWTSPPWNYVGSVFDDFTATARTANTPKKVLVTLGTIPYPFPRLLERVALIVPRGTEVTLQTGATPATGPSVIEVVPQREMLRRSRESDAVVAHAGIGSALMTLTAGIAPVLVPREKRHGEHIDDHQLQIAEELARRDMAISRRVDDLTWEDVCAASAITIFQHPSVAPLVLGP